jgi:hypothetical protein
VGRPSIKSDCDELSAYVHRRNVVCSRNLLERIYTAHAPEQLASLPPSEESVEAEPSTVILSPISNEAIAAAAQIAFPSWVGAIKRIQHAVCAEYGITITELLSQRRHKKIVRPRQIAIYLCKTMTDRSYPEIGRRFGGRDHTTAISSVQRVERLCATDEIFRAQVDSLAESIGEALA